MRRRYRAWFLYQLPMRPLTKHLVCYLLSLPVGNSCQSLRAMPRKGQVKVDGAWWPKELAAPVPCPEQNPSQPSRTDTPGKQRPEGSSEVSLASPVMMLPPGLPGHQGGLLMHLPAVLPKSAAKGKAKATVCSTELPCFPRSLFLCILSMAKCLLIVGKIAYYSVGLLAYCVFVMASRATA